MTVLKSWKKNKWNGLFWCHAGDLTLSIDGNDRWGPWLTKSLSQQLSDWMCARVSWDVSAPASEDVAVGLEGRTRDLKREGVNRRGLPIGGYNLHIQPDPGDSVGGGVQNALWKDTETSPGSRKTKPAESQLRLRGLTRDKEGFRALGPDSPSPALLLPIRLPVHSPWKPSKWKWH